jgi:hypothetical protein
VVDRRIRKGRGSEKPFSQGAVITVRAAVSALRIDQRRAVANHVGLLGVVIAGQDVRGSVAIPRNGGFVEAHADAERAAP